jgi:hypothetical protein
MNLDAVFEDLEAQGYFQSKADKPLSRLSSCKLLRVQLRTATHLLSSPLLGEDFLAGFELKNNRLRWLIIPMNQIHEMESVDGGQELLNTESSLHDLITLKLTGKAIKIINGDSIVSGLVQGVTSNTLHLLKDQNSLWIPLSNLGVVVVEKFSDLA